jgi:hypothetical protein
MRCFSAARLQWPAALSFGTLHRFFGSRAQYENEEVYAIVVAPNSVLVHCTYPHASFSYSIMFDGTRVYGIVVVARGEVYEWSG